ncbi:MAG: hypothetical protein K2G31_04490 [Clostridia bacterium]|nr:hypothetical protein [Clostridia bacterium]
MKIDVELKNSYGRLLKREPIFICDEVFKLKLITNYQMSQYIVVFKNSSIERTNHYSNATEIVIPSELLKEGTLQIKITLLSMGVAVKSWEVEPIILKEADKGLEAFTELEKLRSESADNKNKIEALTNQVSAFSLIIEELKKQITELWQLQES